MARANNLSGESPVLGPPRGDDALRRVLDGFLEGADRARFLRDDPLSLVHRFDDPHDQEVAGLVVAMLAYGRVASIRAKAGEALEALGPRPARTVDLGRGLRRLDGFVHRFQRGDDLPRFLGGVGRLRRRHGSLAAAFAAVDDPSEPDVAPAMGRFVRALGDAIPGERTYGLRFLLPDVGGGGAAKRLCLFLRWMVRPADGIDLGAWPALGQAPAPARLVVPLDTHVARIGLYLGLTARQTHDLATAREITAALRRLRPADPLAYDLAICHLGVSGQCPRRRNPVACAGCPIRGACRLGEEPAGWSFSP